MGTHSRVQAASLFLISTVACTSSTSRCPAHDPAHDPAPDLVHDGVAAELMRGGSGDVLNGHCLFTERSLIIYWLFTERSLVVHLEFTER